MHILRGTREALIVIIADLNKFIRSFISVIVILYYCFLYHISIEFMLENV